MLFGRVLGSRAVVLLVVHLLMLGSCLLDWNYPTEDQADAGTTASASGSGGGHTTFKPFFDGGRGGGGGCFLDCQDCVDCVLSEHSSIASPTDCSIYGACVQQCLGDNSCIASCKLSHAVGAVLRVALDKQCGELCGGLVPCQ